MGSAWDSKLIGGNVVPLVTLRYNVAVAAVEDGWTYREIRERFNVSDGFIRKWSRLYAAHRSYTASHPSANTQIMTRFQSISNRPRKCESPARDEYRDRVLERHSKYGFEGALRIKHALNLPLSPTTITKVLREEGRIGAPKKRHTNLARGSYERPLPNDLWHTDFKQWNFEWGRVESIWIVDDRSRFITGFHIDDHSSADIVIDMFEKATAMFGKPKQIITDHGSEFYSMLGGPGRSKFDRWCAKNGIKHIKSRVRHPQTNGKMERTHRSALEETPYFGDIGSMEEAREVFSKWIEYRNTDCPHSALGYGYTVYEYLSSNYIYEELADAA